MSGQQSVRVLLYQNVFLFFSSSFILFMINQIPISITRTYSMKLINTYELRRLHAILSCYSTLDCITLSPLIFPSGHLPFLTSTLCLLHMVNEKFSCPCALFKCCNLFCLRFESIAVLYSDKGPSDCQIFGKGLSVLGREGLELNSDEGYRFLLSIPIPGK